MKKAVFYGSLISLFLLASCQSKTKSTTNLRTLVPSKTAVILKVDDFSSLAETLQANTFFQKNENLPVCRFFKSAYKPLKQLQITGKSLWCFSKIGSDHFATTVISNSLPQSRDSLGFQQKGYYQYNGKRINKYVGMGKNFYGAKLNGLFVFGDSKLVIENMTRLSDEPLEKDAQFRKLYKKSADEPVVLYLQMPEFRNIYKALLPKASSSFLKKFFGWVSLEPEVKTKSLRVTGISLPDKNEVLGILKGTSPQENKMAEIVPVGAKGFYSVTYDDFSRLKRNLSFFRKKDYPRLPFDLLTEVREMGQIYTRHNTVLAIRSADPEKTAAVLQGQGELKERHRGYKIYTFSKPAYFYKALAPLIDLRTVNYVVKINHFFVFSKRLKSLEGIIANNRDKTVLGQDDAFGETVDYLSDQSSLLAVGVAQNIIKSIAESVDDKYKKDYLGTSFSHYNYGALQFIVHDHFTYINGVFAAAEPGENSRGGIQIESIKPGEKIVAGPWFFINWRNRHYDIVVQGKSNTLYAYNPKGKLLWKTALDGPVLGDVQPIDIYQNHRIQIAFVTPHTFYIVARNGKIVKPYEKHFKDRITQPLAVFDYNHNGHFRFLITQGKNLLMLNKQLKRVKGFEFRKAESKILQAPKHFRLGRKDYIVIPEMSGKLHILNPRGQTRVPVKTKIDFSDNQWYLYHRHFTSTNKKGQLIEIGTDGKIRREDLGLKPDNKMYATAKTLVTFSGNKLTIKGKTTTMDYGLYTAPKIFYIKNKLYIAITDTQAHKAYLFDSASRLFPGFPVYGNATIALKNMDHRGGVELLVRGEDDSVLVYEVQ